MVPRLRLRLRLALGDWYRVIHLSRAECCLWPSERRVAPGASRVRPGRRARHLGREGPGLRVARLRARGWVYILARHSLCSSSTAPCARVGRCLRWWPQARCRWCADEDVGAPRIAAPGLYGLPMWTAQSSSAHASLATATRRVPCPSTGFCPPRSCRRRLDRRQEILSGGGRSGLMTRIVAAVFRATLRIPALEWLSCSICPPAPRKSANA